MEQVAKRTFVKELLSESELSRVTRFSFFAGSFYFFVVVVLLFWYAPTLTIALWGTFVLLVIMGGFWISKQKREKIRLKKACYQKIAEREYQRRLEKISPEVLLRILQEEICKKFKICGLEIKNGFLVGRLWGEDLAVAYLEANREELVASREVLSVIRTCFRQGFSRVKIFTNGDFEPALSNLGEVYGIKLRLYNGGKLQDLLKNTLLFPSISEIKEVINCEKLQQQKRLIIIKKEMLKKQRVTGYLCYSGLLFFMAWFRLGVIYLNVVAGLFLLVFAVLTMYKNSQVREKEKAEVACFFSFRK